MLPDLHQKLPKQAHTSRAQLPDKTIARAKKFMPVMGITRIANVTRLDTIGIPVVMVVRPNSRSVAVSQGKGVTQADATASGLMEAIECYHAENITLPLRLASYEELRYVFNLVNVFDLPFIKNSLFDPDLRLLWIEGYDIVQDETLWLPFELVHTDYRLPPPSGAGCFPSNSNGLASGNHILEAVVHGINEVVERDATTLWSFSPPDYQNSRRVNLATIDDPTICELLDRFEQAAVEVALWDITSDILLPTFMCSIVDRQTNLLRPLYASSGMGTHLTRQGAVVRAMTEAAQSRLTVISGARDDLFRHQYAHYSHPDVVNGFLESILAVSPTWDFAHTPNWEYETLNEDLEQQMRLLQQVGIDRISVVDLSKPYFQIPVVRVTIPKLEGIVEVQDYAPGQRARQFLQRIMAVP